MKKIFLLFIIVYLSFAQTSLRTKFGENTPLEHMFGELRVGYVYQDNSSEIDKKALGAGGHIHFVTKNFYNFNLGLSFYTANDFGFNPKDYKVDDDFLGATKKSGTFVSEAYLKYSLKDLTFKAGRMMIDTPHADSDDIAMIPNYFEGVYLKKEFENFKISFAKLNKMAGYGNGVDAYKFVDLSEVIGVQKTDGMAFVGIESQEYDIDFSIWLYRIFDVADDIYISVGKGFSFDDIDFNIALEFDRAVDSKKSLMGDIDTKTFGFITEFLIKDFTIIGAYNKEFGSTGSLFSFGGGPFFTSMEVQTIDTVESKDAKSYLIGAEYALSEDFNIGIARGEFKDNGDYHAIENDIYFEATIFKDISLEVVAAFIDDKKGDDDFNRFKIFFKKSFGR